jgi:tRNA A37 threonylcarbamoyladenosine modification protein TsaB
MFLLINLSKRDEINLALFNKEKIVENKTSGKNKDLLLSMDKFFTQENFDKNNLKGIMVVVGIGSFTSTRISSVVANSFGYILKIPLLAITENKINQVQELIPELLNQKSGVYISAKYSGEPNITEPKNKK